MLVLSRKKDEALLFDIDGIRIRIVITDIRKGPETKVRLGISAPPEVTVWREELGEFKRSNKTIDRQD